MTSIVEIFENKLKIDSKTVSIDSLFNDDDKRKNTNYKPFYQRNYVWDDEKATYFIESILLGTEIPPLIYFKKISKVEVIDGRQRYQTILRFINNDFKLKRSGLKKLSTKEFIGKNFDSLDPKYKDLIWDTKLRLIEFSFNTKEGITAAIEESLKKEIFKRYNSGITPLKTNEIDKAEFLYDDVNQYFKNEVINDIRLLETLKLLFHFERYNEEVLLKKIRELLVIENIPIKYFSVKKSNIINQFYDYLYEDIENVDLVELRNLFIKKLNLIHSVYKKISDKSNYNRLISECLFWALSIFYNENKHLNISSDEIVKIAKYIDSNIEFYKMDRSSFAIHIKNRYENISKIFKQLYNINFSIYLKDSKVFNEQISDIDSSLDNIEVVRFDDLRINKPEPSSLSINDIVRSMKRHKFIVRPQYQRNEVIDKKKASSIIESILLGIKIPPIFVYKNKDGISEVIDGQQRILTILSFLSEDFINTDNEYISTKKDGYSLSLKNGLLSHLNLSKFSDLNDEYQEKIKNYDLWVVEIDAKYNENFDPVDLFIRLNYKPYPIKIDSFEMWNSYISRDLIDTIKDIFNNNKDWFYVRKTTTRMENENILTALIYLYHQFYISNDIEKSYMALDYYKIGNKINFRLKSKPDLTRTLENDPKKLIDSSNAFEANFIAKLKLLISTVKQKNLALSLDYILYVENGRRTQQSLYALYYFIIEVDTNYILCNSEIIIEDLRKLFNKMNNVKNIDEFNNSVKSFKSTHGGKISTSDMHKIKLENILSIDKGVNSDSLISFSKKELGSKFVKRFASFTTKRETENFSILSTDENRKELKKLFENKKIIVTNIRSLENLDVYIDNEHLYADDSCYTITQKRAGFLDEYLYLLFSSREFYQTYIQNNKISKSIIAETEIPILNINQQLIFKKFYELIISEENINIKAYFINVVNSILKFLLHSSSLKVENLDFAIVIDFLTNEFASESIDHYSSLSNKESQISSFILKMSYLLENK